MPFGALYRIARVATIALVAVAAAPARHAPPSTRAALPPSVLSVWTGSTWREWWRSDAAPDRWRAPHNAVSDAITWRRAGNGVEWGELRLSGVGEARRLRAVAVRIDPRLVRLRLDTAFSSGGDRAAWSIDAAREDAIVAVNVGQFVRALPWGWAMIDGRQFLAPGRGPLSTAIAIDSSGSVRWIGPDGLSNPNLQRGVAAAFQSYPTLLTNAGEIPAPLREPGLGVDLSHRDARLGVGALADGRLLIVLTRFDGLGESLGSIPFGPTIPEFAALMGALGAKQAVALDGGISGQMLIRDADGTHTWRGLRKVPMALVVLPK